MTNIFVAQFINTGLVLVFVFNSFLTPKEDVVAAMSGSSDLFIGPYDEFDSKWFIRIGSSIVFAQAAMLFFPHVFTIIESMGICLTRCIDRKGGWSSKRTSKII